MSILSILLSPEPGCHTLTPLEDRRPHGHVHASSADPCATAGHMSAHLTRTRPCYRKGRLWYQNVTPRPPRGRACYSWQLSRIFRLAPQINTSLFCTLYPHSCAPGNNFPVGHPSSNRSRPSMLNLEFFSDELPKKKVYLVDMSILSILLSPKPRCHTRWKNNLVLKFCFFHVMESFLFFFQRTNLFKFWWKLTSKCKHDLC
jgi:hypothetical protein